MSSISTSDFRIQELAAGFSLGDLSEAERLEIKSFDPKIFQTMVERSEESAATAFLTFQETVPSEPMPAKLSSRLKNMANGFIADSKKSVAANTSTVGRSSMRISEMVAWLCVAASIAYVLFIPFPDKRNLNVRDRKSVV